MASLPRRACKDGRFRSLKDGTPMYPVSASDRGYECKRAEDIAGGIADLIISTGDTHIYKDHVQVMALQISRAPFPQPRLKVNDRVKGIGLEDITEEDFELSGYIHHPRIYGRMSV